MYCDHIATRSSSSTTGTYRTPGEPVSRRPLTAHDRTAIQLAQSDGMVTMRGQIGVSRLLFGRRPSHRLADPRLEAVRRHAVLTRHGRTTAEDAERLAGLGFDAHQIAEIERLAFSDVGGTPAARPQDGRTLPLMFSLARKVAAAVRKCTMAVATLDPWICRSPAPARCIMAITLGVVAVPTFAKSQAIVDATPREIRGAVNILGFDDIAPNTAGKLVFRRDDLVFAGSKSSGSIPFDAIRDVSIEHSNKGLLRGTKGMMASFAPQGIGQMYSLFRPGAETVTILYIDRHQALHGAVMLLPKSRKADVVEAFVGVGLDPGTLPHFASADGTLRAQATQPAAFPPSNEDGRPAVLVGFPVSQAAGLPQAYVAATYEQLILELEAGKAPVRVWRAGDVRAGSESLSLAVTITRAKKGNAGVRGAVPVVGMIAGKTLLEADVRLTDASGNTKLDGPFKGSKRMPGESIGATQSLAQRVARAIGKSLSSVDTDGRKVLTDSRSSDNRILANETAR